MPKNNRTLRLPEDLAAQAELIARAEGTSVNQLVVDSLAERVKQLRSDKAFMARLNGLVEADREILKRLAKT